jgi:ABC-type amino acid transport system permease subunit
MTVTVSNPGRPRERPAWMRSKKARVWAFQMLAVLAFSALVLWLGNNARVNMAQRNITFGFDFLLHPAGFDILCLPITPSECIDNGGRRAMGLM